MSETLKELYVSSDWDFLFQGFWPIVKHLPKEQCISKLLLLAMEHEVNRLHTASSVKGQGPSSAALDPKPPEVEDPVNLPVVVEEDSQTQAPLRGVGYGPDGEVDVVYESEPIYESQQL